MMLKHFNNICKLTNLSLQRKMSRIMRVFLLLSILMFGTWYLDLANEIKSLKYELVNCEDSASNLCKHLNISTASCEECVSYWNERVHMCLSGHCKSF